MAIYNDIVITENSERIVEQGCSSVVIVFAHDAMGRRIDPSWWTHSAISCSSQCSMTGASTAVVCVILSGMMHIRDPCC